MSAVKAQMEFAQNTWGLYTVQLTVGEITV